MNETEKLPGKHILLLCLAAALLFSSCATLPMVPLPYTVPFTNRTSVLAVSSEQEVSLGVKAFDELKATSKFSNNQAQVQLLEKVGKKISAVADRPEYKWEFVLIDDSSTVNAFCLPGGKVAFYTGILPLCRDENGIAVVMGHEIAHAVARHGAERMTDQGFIDIIGKYIDEKTGKLSPEKQKMVLGAYGLAANLGVMLPFSRKHEYEADYIGLILMAKAGYDPSVAVGFWQRMSEMSGGGKVPEFISTHPSDEKRIENIKQKLPEVLPYYKK